MTLPEQAKLWRTRLLRLHSENTIHWKAPAIMVLSLGIGILLSFIHNAFNMAMDGHSAGGATEQQWVRRAETAFAFASRLFLGIATTVAYTQYLWFYLQRHNSRLSSLDAMFSATNNSFRVIHVRLWRRRPVLALIAFVTWFLPFAAVFTPGTLTVQPQARTHISDVEVPERRYTDATSFYASTLTANDSTVYKGMSIETTRNVGRVQLANDMLPMPRPDKNVTYSTTFAGPALSCERMKAAAVTPVDKALQSLMESSFEYHGSPLSGSQMVYFGWVPQTKPGLDEVSTSFFEKYIDAGDGASSSNLDYVSSDVARIYVYLNTSGLLQDVNNDGQFYRTSEATLSPPAMVTCKLYNASYDAHFDVRNNGEQNISATTTFLNWQSTLDQGSDNADSFGKFSAQALMEAFGWTFTQFIYVAPSNESATIYGTHALEMNPALVPVQAHMDSAKSPEYMMRQMEDFFKNMTLSLRYADLPDSSNDSSTRTVNSNSEFFRSDYVYEPDALIISYVISDFASLLCVMVGIYAIYKNGASFTSHFSTIVRVTNHLDLEESIDEKDRSGSDPLPKHFADTVINLGDQRQQVKQDVLAKTTSASISDYSPYKTMSMSDYSPPYDHVDWQNSTSKAMGLR